MCILELTDSVSINANMHRLSKWSESYSTVIRINFVCEIYVRNLRVTIKVINRSIYKRYENS